MSHDASPAPTPTAKRRLRWAIIALVAAVYAWMSIEDSHLFAPALLGAGVAGATVARGGLRYLAGYRALPAGQGLVVVCLLGALWGVGSSLATALLMVFKNAWHDHPFPDFPPGLVLDMLARSPAWALAGGLLALGAALIARGVNVGKN